MSLKLAQEFATLLNSNRYDEASQFIGENCDYHYSEGNYHGRNNIISIFCLNHRESKKIFDETNYSSVVEELPDGNYRISFVDKIRKDHKWHEFRSLQILTIKENQIVNIRHSEIPGEMESLRLFYSIASSQKMNLP